MDSETPVRRRPELLLAAGALLWLIAVVATWPVALSFGDEAGYVGQARLLLHGQVRPQPESPGVWVTTGTGRASKLPLFFPLLVAPLFAIAPRLVFATGAVAALALTFVASRVLRSWGRGPGWALLLLAHPTVVILARTVMADLLLAAFAVAAWWALRRGRSRTAAALLLLVVATKPTGVPIALALVVGEAIRARRELGARDRRAVARLAWAAGGVLGGVALVAALNLVSAGKLGFAYDEGLSYLGTPSFWPRYLPSSAPVHLASLLLLPPLLLIFGVRPFWRRREPGPLLVIGGLTGMMCFYFFVDRGRSWIDTLVLSPRLIVPVFAFLLIGYAEELAALAARAPRGAPRALAAVAAVAPALICLAISSRHRAWQERDGAALALASRTVADLGAEELGLTWNTLKAGMLHPGPVSLVVPGLHEPAVVLCNTRSDSYRHAEGSYSCTLPGYDDRAERGGFHILVRRAR
jgi:hypothetical protein